MQLDLEQRDRLRERARALAQSVLSGEAYLLEVSRDLWGALQGLDLDWEDEDCSAFGLIASETEHLPIGSQRQYWSAEALERKNPEILRARSWAESAMRLRHTQIEETVAEPSTAVPCRTVFLRRSLESRHAGGLWLAGDRARRFEVASEGV